MRVYRITNRKHSHDIFGTGSALYPGRWNKKGTRVLYTGESKEIALLEVLVHANNSLIPFLDILTIEIPDNSIKKLSLNELPINWSEYPAPTLLSEIGDSWAKENKTLALKVPSCIIDTSHVFILNCNHPNYNQVKVIDHRKFKVDIRLIQKF